MSLKGIILLFLESSGFVEIVALNQGTFIILIFDGCPAYFDVSVCSTAQPAFVFTAAVSASAAAVAREEAKDEHCFSAVFTAGGVLFLLL